MANTASSNEIARLLPHLQTEFGWGPPAERFDLVEYWQRRSGSEFHQLIGVPAGPEVVVKTMADWSESDAERLFQVMTELASLADSTTGQGARAVEPLAWAGRPPLLVMPYLAGTDLVSLLREPTRSEWEHMGIWMGQAGAILSTYHAAHSSPPDVDEAPAQMAEEAARRMKLSPASTASLLEAIDWRHRSADSFGDFGPGNFMGTTSGELYLLDPPGLPSSALIHKDIGNFLFEMRRQLAGRGYTRTAPVRGRFTQLRQSFLDGYGDAARRPLTPADEGVIALFEMRRAAGLARKRLPRRPGDSLWFARLAIRLRGQVVRLALGQGGTAR